MKQNFVAVIGAGFGDCGKGLVTNYLSQTFPNPLVIRFSGGHNAGHTVYSNDKTYKHVFSNFGSGTLNNAPTYISRFCTVDPVGLIKELDVLKTHNLMPNIFIDPECPITTPYDIEFNQINSKNKQHGSVGVGYGATHQRENDFYSLKFIDLFYKEVFKEKLKNISMYYNVSPGLKNMDFFHKCCERIQTCALLSFAIPTNFETYIFEGSQGLLLDQHFGFFPNVTRSNTGTKNIFELIPKDSELDIYLVTRAYQTRHGNGYMTNKNLPHNIKIDERETNISHEFQGKFRRTLLDLDLLEYGIIRDKYIHNNNKRKLVITCTDHIQNEYRLTANGNIKIFNSLDQFVNYVSDFLNFKTVLISNNPYSELSKISIST